MHPDIGINTFNKSRILEDQLQHRIVSPGITMVPERFGMAILLRNTNDTDIISGIEKAESHLETIFSIHGCAL